MSHCRVFILVAAAFLLGGSSAAIVKREAAAAGDVRVKREAASAPGVCNRPTQLTAEQIKQALDSHNNVRSTAGNSDPNDSTASDAANMPPMVWDDGLASSAQDWTDSCIFEYGRLTECDGKTPVGQNLNMITSFMGITDPATVDVTHFVNSWASDKYFYDIATQACASGHVCSQYIQIVWAKTTRVGCGISSCPTITYGSWLLNGFIFMCLYSPQGNDDLDIPYVVGAPCSKCQNENSVGGWLCNDNLCETCTPDGNANCKCTTLECLNGGTWDAGKCECRCPADYFGNKCERAYAAA